MEEKNKLFAEEIAGQIGALVETKRHPDGRWSAWLTPGRDFVLAGAFPPGQANIVGYDGWIVENEYTAAFEAGEWLKEVKEDVDKYRAAWAARPFFYSHKAAQAHVERWIRENRPDIVRECAGEAARALAYRRGVAAKAEEAAARNV